MRARPCSRQARLPYSWPRSHRRQIQNVTPHSLHRRLRSSASHCPFAHIPPSSGHAHPAHAKLHSVLWELRAATRDAQKHRSLGVDLAEASFFSTQLTRPAARAPSARMMSPNSTPATVQFSTRSRDRRQPKSAVWVRRTTGLRIVLTLRLGKLLAIAACVVSSVNCRASVLT